MIQEFEVSQKWIENAAKYFIQTLWNIDKYKIHEQENISSIFLAGAPGAWKTEFLETVLNDLRENFIVIDIDMYRKSFKWYNGENSSEYQKTSVRVADKVLKFCFKNELNFIFDGTFRNYNKVKQNFKQCEKYERKCLVALVFQDPRVSFYYTFLRKLKKKRNVPIDVFVDGFYGSIESVFLVKKHFKNVDIIIANKKYNFANKDKFTYNVDYAVSNIVEFCKNYHIAYNKGIFTNRYKVKLDIESFNDTLSKHFWKKWSMFMNIKMWFIKRLYNLK